MGTGAVSEVHGQIEPLYLYCGDLRALFSEDDKFSATSGVRPNQSTDSRKTVTGSEYAYRAHDRNKVRYKSARRANLRKII